MEQVLSPKCIGKGPIRRGKKKIRRGIFFLYRDVFYMLFIDLFAGAGGWSAGLREAGMEHVCGVELDKTACESYRANHTNIINKNISDVILEDFEPYLRGRVLDVLVASPPCQSFSRACKNNAPTEADRLYVEVIRLAEMLEPEWVVVENVPPFQTKILHDGDRLTAADDLTRQLMSAGYARIESRVLLASNYGVAQLRKRFILIARRSMGPPIPWPDFVSDYDISIARFLQNPEDVLPFYWMSHQKESYFMERMRTHPAHVRIVDPSRPAYTLLASYYKSRGSQALVRQDARLRMLTELELRRIMGFSDDYVLCGGHTAQCRAVCNAVPPPMAFALGRAIMGA